jgi:osmoprotectant transport system substrate-binding protein
MAGDARRPHARAWATVACVLAVVLALAGCGSSGTGAGTASGHRKLPGTGRPPVRLGTKNFTEQFVLGQLYAQALRAKGFRVELKQDIGSSEVMDQALTSHGIDLYPEYTGTALSVVKGQDPLPKSSATTYRDARAFYAGRGQVLLAQTPFEDRDAIAVTKRFSHANGGLHSTGDLARLGAKVTLGAAPEFRTRFAGLIGLRQEYGLRRLRFEAMPIGQVYPALDAGRIQAADVFTTDGQLASKRYVVLTDPKKVFGVQHLAPVVDRGVLRRQGPEFARTLDAVSAKLTNEVMQRMNAAVALRGERPADVARAFLRRQHLL